MTQDLGCHELGFLPPWLALASISRVNVSIAGWFATCRFGIYTFKYVILIELQVLDLANAAPDLLLTQFAGSWLDAAPGKLL